MKIYILMSHEYESSDIEDVFLDESKAEVELSKLNSDRLATIKGGKYWMASPRFEYSLEEWDTE